MRSILRRLNRLPLIGWLFGALALCGLLLALALRKLRIARAQLAIEHQLRKVQKDKDKAVTEILTGHRARGLDRQTKAAQRSLYYERERSKLMAKTLRVGGIADAVDKAFSRRP